MKNVVVRKSKIQGKGVFAAKSFRKGDKMYTIRKGPIIPKKDISLLPKSAQLHLDRVSRNCYEIIQPPGCFINHSCEPNTGERAHAGYALRDIGKGKELTMDYRRIAFPEGPFRCHCESKKCVKVIHGQR